MIFVFELCNSSPVATPNTLNAFEVCPTFITSIEHQNINKEPSCSNSHLHNIDANGGEGLLKQHASRIQQCHVKVLEKRVCLLLGHRKGGLACIGRFCDRAVKDGSIVQEKCLQCLLEEDCVMAEEVLDVFYNCLAFWSTRPSGVLYDFGQACSVKLLMNMFFELCFMCCYAVTCYSFSQFPQLTCSSNRIGTTNLKIRANLAKNACQKSGLIQKIFVMQKSQQVLIDEFTFATC